MRFLSDNWWKTRKWANYFNAFFNPLANFLPWGIGTYIVEEARFVSSWGISTYIVEEARFVSSCLSLPSSASPRLSRLLARSGVRWYTLQKPVWLGWIGNPSLQNNNQTPIIMCLNYWQNHNVTIHLNFGTCTTFWTLWLQSCMKLSADRWSKSYLTFSENDIVNLFMLQTHVLENDHLIHFCSM